MTQTLPKPLSKPGRDERKRELTSVSVSLLVDEPDETSVSVDAMGNRGLGVDLGVLLAVAARR